MVELKTDRELLRDYAEGRNEHAFTMLVQRHLDLVFSTALRGLGNVQAAQEITQNVFIALARKAAWLRGETSLSGWLHKTTLLEVRRWWRGELRRQRHEQTAIELGTVMNNEDTLLKALAGELDEGLLELRETDRQALMLRYFEGRTHREIGQLLGAREDAVRMRIDKALGRLTRFFRRRGYAVPTVATTVTLLGAVVIPAPAGFAMVAARSALAAGGSGAATGLKLLLSRLLGLSRAQTSFLCLAIAAGPGTWEWNVKRVCLARAALAQSQLEVVREAAAQSAADLGQLRAESARLEVSVAEAEKDSARYGEAARKLEALKRQVRDLLAGTGSPWPTNLPYVRVPKAIIRSLDPHYRPMGRISELALELYGITAQEKAPAEQAVARYFQGVYDLMAATAYETTVSNRQPVRLVKVVTLAPPEQPLQALGEQTGLQLADVLGGEREKLLFDGGSKKSVQTITCSVEPSSTNGGAPRCEFTRAVVGGGTLLNNPYVKIPEPILERFFYPWLDQLGVTNRNPSWATSAR
ncbi:MAG: sigma-70 family RNA polymerase sigma factor [Verrucomicrobiota bacterium]